MLQIVLCPPRQIKWHLSCKSEALSTFNVDRDLSRLKFLLDYQWITYMLSGKICFTAYFYHKILLVVLKRHTGERAYIVLSNTFVCANIVTYSHHHIVKTQWQFFIIQNGTLLETSTIWIFNEIHQIFEIWYPWAL